MSDLPTLSGPMALPAAGGDPQSLVVLLHGYGSNGDDLIGLVPYWSHLLPHTVFVSPNAPEPCPGAPGGYQWWALTDLSPQARVAGVRRAAPTVNAFLDAQLARWGLGDDKLALVGFSQGTMTALHVAPRRLRGMAGVVGYSGMLGDPDGLAAEARSKPPVLLVHGEADPMIPVAALPAAEGALKAAGFEVSAHISPGLGHSVDDAGLRLGGAFLRRVLGG